MTTFELPAIAAALLGISAAVHVVRKRRYDQPVESYREQRAERDAHPIREALAGYEAACKAAPGAIQCRDAVDRLRERAKSKN